METLLEIQLTAKGALSSGEVIKEGVRKICVMCHKEYSKYKCPKCTAPYCSAVCYKTHDTRCTEAFYKDLVETELRTNHLQASAADRDRMMESLKRMNEEEQPGDFFVEDEMDEDAMQKLESLALEDKLTLEHLTEEQRASFMNAVENGSLSDLIEIWQPFWTRPVPPPGRGSVGKPKIEVLDGDSSPEYSAKGKGSTDRITILSNIPDFKQLSRKPSSPLLKYNLLNILFPYCHTARRYNGDWCPEPVSALSLIVELSPVLEPVVPGAAGEKPRVVAYNSTHEALDASMEAAARVGLTVTGGVQDYDTAILQDVALVTSHQHFVMLALSHLHALTATVLARLGESSTTMGKRSYSDPRIASRPVARIQKKLLYYLSWAQSLEPHMFDELSAEVFAAWTEHIARAKQTAARQTTIPVEPVRK